MLKTTRVRLDKESRTKKKSVLVLELFSGKNWSAGRSERSM